MKVLVVGGGAREHAICDTVVKSKDVELYSVMKNLNPGIEKLVKEYLIENETNIKSVADYAENKSIDLVLIGPEAPLEKGLVNELEKRGIQTCAPTKEAARIETDKEWMRNLLKKYNIPGQLKYKTFSNMVESEKFIKELNGKVALKPIGLTGGKGVWVHGDHFNNVNEAMEYAKNVIENEIGGYAKILIEEKAEGEEFTLQGFSDGENILTFPAVQDHKRLLPGDEGPNTGGMGSYSYSNGLLPFLNQKDYNEGVRILKKIIKALNEESCPYVGPIYGQFMLTKDGPKIIEINARFGDPENMNVLPLLKTDYIKLCEAMLNQTLDSNKLSFDKKSTVCKYVVPEGYGYKSIADKKIEVNENLINDSGAKLFYASVNKKNSDVYTTTSRSLAIVGIADEIQEAEKICEKSLSHIKSDHIFIRHDIGTSDLIQKRIEHINQIRGK